MRTSRPAVLLSVLSLVAASLAGCGGGAGPDGPGERRFLSLGTAPPGGTFFIVGGAIAESLGQAGGERNWQVTAEATKGSQENIRRLVQGELDLALSNAAITYFAVRGEAGWDRPYAVRSVMTLAPNVALFIAPRSSGVRTIADLRGRRVVLGPAGAGFEYFLTPILEAHGLGLADLDGLNNTQTAAVDMLDDGSAAAAFLGGAIPTASITQAAAGQDVVFVPYDAEPLAQLVERYVFFRPATIPAGTYRGLDADYNGLDVGSMHLIAAAGADEDLIYDLTRAIWESREAIIERHPAGRAINAANAVRDTGTEFHPGAVRYYREIGIWPAG